MYSVIEIRLQHKSTQKHQVEDISYGGSSKAIEDKIKTTRDLGNIKYYICSYVYVCFWWPVVGLHASV